MDFNQTIETAGKAIDVAGVAAIVLGSLFATAVFVNRVRSPAVSIDSYREYRQSLGRAILLGLELLVAADIVRTVAASPNFRSVGVLGAIVLIRTFLSFSLQLELTGKWPWQEADPSSEC